MTKINIHSHQILFASFIGEFRKGSQNDFFRQLTLYKEEHPDEEITCEECLEEEIQGYYRLTYELRCSNPQSYTHLSKIYKAHYHSPLLEMPVQLQNYLARIKQSQ